MNKERTSQFLGQMKEALSLTKVSQDLAASASTLKTQVATTLNEGTGSAETDGHRYHEGIL